jgi:hypothetical protein
MANILVILFFVFYFVNAVYPTGCQNRGYECIEDDSNDKYFECNEYFEGIKTCPRGTKCLKKGLQKVVIPCEPVKTSVRTLGNSGTFENLKMATDSSTITSSEILSNSIPTSSIPFNQVFQHHLLNH